MHLAAKILFSSPSPFHCWLPPNFYNHLYHPEILSPVSPQPSTHIQLANHLEISSRLQSLYQVPRKPSFVQVFHLQHPCDNRRDDRSQGRRPHGQTKKSKHSSPAAILSQLVTQDSRLLLALHRRHADPRIRPQCKGSLLLSKSENLG